MTMSVFWFHLIFEYKSSGGSIFCSRKYTNVLVLADIYEIDLCHSVLKCCVFVYTHTSICLYTSYLGKIW